MITKDRLLQIARKMHLWIFLHCDNEHEVYDELGLSDKENKILGYSGRLNFKIKDKELVDKVKRIINEVNNDKNR